MQISVTLSDFDAAVFSLVAGDPDEWVKNAVEARVLAKKRELGDAETARRRQAGEPPLATLDALVAAALKRLDGNGEAPVVSAPDNSTLSDWRCGLALWKRPDGTLRLDEVTAKVAELVASGHPLGRIARERLEYANNVTRAQLGQLAGLFGFTAAEIEESLWRAERVRQGDLSGTWPLPAGNSSNA